MSIAELRESLASERAHARQQHITVLAGGGSAEREVSLTSGRSVADALDGEGFSCTLLAIGGDGFSADQAGSRNLDKLTTNHSAASGAQELLALLQASTIVFTVMHGTRGEDGNWQGLLELLGVPYVSASVKGSALAMDKLASKRIFQQLGIPTPRYWVIREAAACRAEISGDVTDLVAKPAEQGSSVGIEIVKNDDAGWKAIMAQAANYKTLLVEERIFGRELTCAVVGLDSGPVALPLVEIRPKEVFYNYTAKYTKGASEYVCPAPLNENLAWQIQQQALQIYREFELSPYARIDCLLDERGVPWFLEANTLPGFTELSLLPMAARTAGLDYAGLLELLLALAWRRWLDSRGGAG